VHVGDTYQVTLDRSSSFAEYFVVTVRVYAEDLAAIPNGLDTTYDFRTWDLSGPTISPYGPTGSGVSKTTPITLSIRDAGSGVAISTLDVSVDAVQAVINGVFQTGFDGPGSQIVPVSGGYDVTIQKTTQYDCYNLTDVSVYVEDLATNITSLSWNFRIEDYLGPLVEPIYPLSGDVNIPAGSNVSFQISDLDSVVAASIKVNIDQGGGVLIPAFDWTASPKFKPGFNGPGSSYGVVGGVYTIVVDPEVDFLVASIARVEVLATDPTGNPARL
jgi:hypothetical protein